MVNDKIVEFSEMPGPRGIPMLGSALSLLQDSAKVLMQWGNEHYGNVFRFRMFFQDCVVLNGYAAVKEGIVTNGSDMSGRIAGPLMEATRDNRGLFFLDYGTLWKKWSPFIIKAMSATMPELPDRIEDQAQKFLSEISELNVDTTPIDIKEMIRYRMAQITTISFLNKEFLPNEKEELLDLIDNIYAPFRTTKYALTMFMPKLSYIPPFSGYLAGEKARREAVMAKFIEWIKKHHKGRESEKMDARNITDAFFKENPDADVKDLEQLAIILMDWMFAGTSTVAEQLMWVVLHLVKHPEMMKSVQTELDKATESYKHVADLFKHQDKVPKFMAFIEETLRMRPIAPGSLYHKTIQDTVVCGYKIPKNVIVIPNIWSVHHDPEIWSHDLESFNPDRHISGEGKFVPSKFVIPFGIGERRCPGARIAKANIFIFVASLLLRYDLSLAEDSKNVSIEGVHKAVLETPSFNLRMKPRK